MVRHSAYLLRCVLPGPLNESTELSNMPTNPHAAEKTPQPSILGARPARSVDVTSAPTPRLPHSGPKVGSGPLSSRSCRPLQALYKPPQPFRPLLLPHSFLSLVNPVATWSISLPAPTPLCRTLCPSPHQSGTAL